MPIRVAVVRPDRPAHTLIAAAFEMSGCEVHCASDGVAAWRLIVHKKPDIVFVEYPEQVEGGIDLLHRGSILRDHGTVVAAAVSNALSAEQTRVVAGYTDLCYRMPTPPADVVARILRHAAARRDEAKAAEPRSGPDGPGAGRPPG